ncbi:MAG: 3-phosphoshikimate 1-carboxyvinyltransferase [Ruminococcaceae bacterium]|nr:3-phosphoshikimate 1-carboxyvinyltransferase [Oscillospiraceae bacterium]
MDITISPSKLSGTLTAIPSKSQAHRMLICAAFADVPTAIHCPQTNRDIEATANCLRALGAEITYNQQEYHVIPAQKVPKSAQLPCGESGSTLRFMLPIVGALGVNGIFRLEGRLPQRPLSPLWEEMERMGCKLTRLPDGSVACEGRLRSGYYRIDGSVSSQFITGLMLAMPLIDGDCDLEITGRIESAPYIEMTRKVMSQFEFDTHRKYRSPGALRVEGDWSNAAFFLAAKALGSHVNVAGLDEHSAQGDRAVSELLPLLQKSNCIICAADIPDLIPILSVVAAANHGARFTQIERLRLKESDRVAAVIAMLESLGGRADATEDTLTVYPSTLCGGMVNGFNDHRIVMSAAIASTVCTAPVTVTDAEAVNKSYPDFWAEFRRLGGHYEQYLR